MEKTEDNRVIHILGYVASLMIVGAIIYALINGAVAASLGFPGGVPEVDLEASFVVGGLGVILFIALAVYRGLKSRPDE